MVQEEKTLEEFQKEFEQKNPHNKNLSYDLNGSALTVSLKLENGKKPELILAKRGNGIVAHLRGAPASRDNLSNVPPKRAITFFQKLVNSASTVSPS